MSFTDRFWDDWRVFFGVFFAVIVLVFAGAVVLTEQMSLPGHLSKIEQLRADAAHVDPAQAEDVIGQVTVWNQTIREKQTLNDQWWAGWAIPDEWDSVALIPVPQ